jgi:hypothetical protein
VPRTLGAGVPRRALPSHDTAEFARAVLGAACAAIPGLDPESFRRSTLDGGRPLHATTAAELGVGGERLLMPDGSSSTWLADCVHPKRVCGVRGEIMGPSKMWNRREISVGSFDDRCGRARR